MAPKRPNRGRQPAPSEAARPKKAKTQAPTTQPGSNKGPSQAPPELEPVQPLTQPVNGYEVEQLASGKRRIKHVAQKLKSATLDAQADKGTRQPASDIGSDSDGMIAGSSEAPVQRGRGAKGRAGGTARKATGKAAAGAEVSDGPAFYLMKSEPHEFSIDDQAAKPEGTYCWEGVRNAQARNIMKVMKVGEQIFFYHSSCKVPGIVGLCRVAKEAYPDHTAWDPNSKYFDPRSSQDAPKWHMVDVQFVRKMKRMVTLEELKQYKYNELAGMVLLNRSRLSVQKLTQQQWQFIMSLEDKPPPEKH